MNQKQVIDNLKIGTRIYKTDISGEVFLFEHSKIGSGYKLSGVVGVRAESVQYLLAPLSGGLQEMPWEDLQMTKTYPRRFSGELLLPQKPHLLYLRTTRKNQQRVENPILMNPALIFIIAGQSNAAGFSKHLFYTHTGKVFYGSVENNEVNWRPAYDPGIEYGGGSLWPQVGDHLHEAFGLSVGFINIAVGGSSIAEWQPKTDNHDRLIKVISKARDTGLTAVLWHQGETDGNMEYSEYRNYLEELILQSRHQTNMNDIPWLISTATFDSLKSNKNVRRAQQDVRNPQNNIFAGPDTDLLGLQFRDVKDKVHFNREGTLLAKDGWVEFLHSFLEHNSIQSWKVD